MGIINFNRVKFMEANESLTIVTPQIKAKILGAINCGLVNTAADIANLFPDVSEEKAIELLNEDEFYLQIANQTRARMRLLYHTKGTQVLEDLLDSSDNKDRIAGYDRLAKATGGMQEEKGGVNNFNFFNIEDLLEAKEKKVRRNEKETIDAEFKPIKKFNRVKTRAAEGSEVNGNIFENEEAEEELEYDIEEMFEESEELEFDD